VRASHTGRAVAPATTLADTANREWSSIPDTIFASEPSTMRTPPTMSICHSSITRARFHRLWSERFRFLACGMTSPWRIRQHSTELRPGNGDTPARSNQNRIVRGPQPGCARRISTIRASSSEAI
jgi:hypothetical protein